MTGDAPFDPGLQPERTLLGWRRTALSLAVVGAVVVRFTAEVMGVAALALGAMCLVAAGAAYALASARYRRMHAGLVSTGRLPTDGRPLIWLSAALGVVCVSAGLFVVGVGIARL